MVKLDFLKFFFPVITTVHSKINYVFVQGRQNTLLPTITEMIFLGIEFS